MIERTDVHKLLERVKDVLPGGDEWDQEAGLLDPEYQLAMLRFREEHMLAGVARRLKRGIDDGLNPGEVFSRVQDHVIGAARATSSGWCSRRSSRRPRGGCRRRRPKVALGLLCDLFALSTIEADRAWFMEHGRLTSARSKAISREVDGLCRKIRPLARRLVDALGVPREMLRSPDLRRDPHEAPARAASPGRVERRPAVGALRTTGQSSTRGSAALLWRVGIRQRPAPTCTPRPRRSAGSPRVARILDIPCGGGVALRGVRPGQGVTYVAADIAPAMLDRTCRGGREPGRVDQVWSRGSRTWSTCRSTTTPSTWWSPSPACTASPTRRARCVEMVRVLRPGGRLTGSALLNDSGLRTSRSARRPARRAARPGLRARPTRRARCAG